MGVTLPCLKSLKKSAGFSLDDTFKKIFIEVVLVVGAVEIVDKIKKPLKTKKKAIKNIKKQPF
jgi:hypothetical protein